MVYISVLPWLIYILPFAAGDVTDLGGGAGECCYRDASHCGTQTNARTHKQRHINRRTDTHRHKEVNNSHF